MQTLHHSVMYSYATIRSYLQSKSEKAGKTVSTEQLQAYRDQLRAGQDNFGPTLKNRGVSSRLRVDVPDFTARLPDMLISANTLVLNGIVLSTPSVLKLSQSMRRLERRVE